MEFWPAYLSAFAHFVSAVSWAGGVFFYSAVLVPGLGALPADRQRETWRAVMGRLHTFFILAGIGTIAFGALAGIAMGRYREALGLESRWGVAIVAAVVLAIVAFAVGWTGGNMARRVLDDDRYWTDPAFANERDRTFALTDRLDKIELAILPVVLALMALARFS